MLYLRRTRFRISLPNQNERDWFFLNNFFYGTCRCGNGGSNNQLETLFFKTPAYFLYPGQPTAYGLWYRGFCRVHLKCWDKMRHSSRAGAGTRRVAQGRVSMKILVAVRTKMLLGVISSILVHLIDIIYKILKLPSTSVYLWCSIHITIKHKHVHFNTLLATITIRYRCRKRGHCSWRVACFVTQPNRYFLGTLIEPPYVEEHFLSKL